MHSLSKIYLATLFFLISIQCYAQKPLTEISGVIQPSPMNNFNTIFKSDVKIDDKYKTSTKRTFINGNLTIGSKQTLVVNDGDTLIVFGSIYVENHSFLVNKGSIVIENDLILGKSEKDKMVSFFNTPEASLLVGNNMHGPHPTKCKFGGNIIVNNEVRVRFKGNDLKDNKSFFYGSNSVTTFKSKIEDPKNMDIIMAFGNTTKVIPEYQDINNLGDEYLTAMKENPKTAKYRNFVGGVPDDLPSYHLIQFLSNDPTTADQLPVELTYFSVAVEDGKIVTFWETTKEINSSHFILERSFDGKKYKVIFDNIEAAGNSDRATQYKVKDPKEQRERGKTYYRLTQVDRTGKEETWIEVIEFGKKQQGEVLSVYPQLVQDEVNVILKLLPNETPTFKLICTKTYQVKELPTPTYDGSKATIDFSGIPPGSYTLIVRLNENVSHRDQIVVQGTENVADKE